MAVGAARTRGFNNPSVITANQVVTIKGGFLGYSPSKGANNLIVSINPGPAFFDPYGNEVLPGMTNYYTGAGLPYTATQVFQGQINWWTATVSEHSWSLITNIQAWQNSGNAGLWLPSWPSVGKRLWIGGVVGNPTPTTALVVIQPNNAGDLIFGTLLFSDLHNRWQIDDTGLQSWGDGTHLPDATLQRVAAAIMQFGSSLEINGSLFVQGVASPPAVPSGYVGMWADNFGDLHSQGSLFIDGQMLALSVQGSAPPTGAGQTRIVGSGAGLPFMVAQDGQGWFLSGASQNDPNVPHTVTAASFTQISGTWTIDAADASLNDIYVLELEGHGTQGTTPQNLTFSAFGTANVGTVGGQIPINTNFTWRLTSHLVITATGVGGTCNITTRLEIGFGTSGTLGILELNSATGLAFNTTVPNNFVAQAAWGSTTGAPTVTCHDNWIEKKS